jgi:hypothetical protein
MNNRFGSGAQARRSAGAAETTSSVGWEGAEAQSQSLHVITLVSSTAPLPLQAPKAPELAGLAVFRSRRVEDGRERFRLHIGYFPSAQAAERLLPVVRTIYPMAFVSQAPQSNLGSLDDTAVARFSILKPIEAGSEPAAAQAVQPAQPAAPRPARPLAPLPAARARPATAVAPSPAAAPPAAREPSRPQAEPKPVQRYAVQLVWSRDAIDLGKIPSLAIFGGYLLYAVETGPGGRRMYGVRLGFYEDALSARLVAQYVRSEFKGVAIVPVSEREFSRASSAAIHLTSARTARGSSSARVRWPQAAVTVDEFAPAATNRAAASL